jgi:CheY-like chemotaxis protein
MEFPPPDALADCRVLLVEDDDDTRTMLASVLLGHGAQVRACGSAAEALDATAQLAPTLVISDIGMPGMDGYDFIRAFRLREAAHGDGRVPAVALTAFARDEDRRRALAEGFQLHVAKPVQPAELVSIARSLCDGARRTATG